MDQANSRTGLVDVLTAGTGGTEHLHLVVLRADLYILAVILNVRDNFNGSKGGLPAGVCIKGRHAHQAVNAILALQKAVGILTLNQNICRFQAGLVAFQIQSQIGRASCRERV